MNLHPAEGRPLLEDEQVIVPWPRSWPNSPIVLVKSRNLKEIGFFWIFFSCGSSGFQIHWPGWFRLAFHRGVYLILHRWIYMGLSAGRAYFGLMEPRVRWIRRSS